MQSNPKNSREIASKVTDIQKQYYSDTVKKNKWSTREINVAIVQQKRLLACYFKFDNKKSK